MLEYVVDNSVWASNGETEVGSSLKKFSGGVEVRAERGNEILRGPKPVVKSSSLWLCYAKPLLKDRKVRT